jgi:choline dehydrogenase-like flavoprotein
MRRPDPRVAAAGALLLLIAAGSRTRTGATLKHPPPTDSTTHRIHDAVFDTWLPIDSLTLPDSLRADARRIRSDLWRSFGRSREIRWALEALADLRELHRACSHPYPRAAAADSFQNLGLAARESALLGLLRCEKNVNRQHGMQLRLAYLGAIYATPFGRAVADVPPPAVAADTAATPRFPPTWLRHDPLAHRLAAAHGAIDDIIVGSGPAGSVLAHQLAGTGRRVLLLDQGPFVVPGSMNTRAHPRMLESSGRRSSASGSVLFNNAQAVGGGSAVNIDLVFSPTHPGVQKQIRLWRWRGDIRRDQWVLDSLRSAERWVKAMLGTRTPAESEVNANNGALRDGARRRGLHPKLYELNTHPPGAWPTAHTDKRSTVSQLLLPAMQDARHPLAVVPDARVTRVLIAGRTGDRAVRGVEFVVLPPWGAPGVLGDPHGLGLRAGDTLTVEADRVILCAGALGSAAILLRSDIIDPDIGRGIVGHVAVPVIGMFEERIDPFRGTPATVFVDDHALSGGYMLEAMSAGPEYAALMVPGSGREVFDAVRRYRHLAGFGAMLIDTPSPANRIRLDAAGQPAIVYELSSGDRARLRAAIAEAVRIMFAAGARKVFVPSHEDIYGAPGAPLVLTAPGQVVRLERNLKFQPNATIVTSAHLQASNKMGTRNAGSVVDTHHQVWEVRRLYVMDASVFPGSVGANPMQSIYVMAKLFADELIAADRARGRE